MPAALSPATATPAGQPTLAQQASLRQASSRQALLGFIVICLAVWNFASYLAHEHQSAGRFIIPALVGLWLFRGAARKREQSRAATRVLPPLNLPPKP
ncbi:putative membrane protein [Bordetella holmesii 44057]|nr:putative membrane protein [Bordetella holmesii 44057]